ncbi:hypothetical protein GCM10010483_24910 [Actinokineospora diospyrosa]
MIAHAHSYLRTTLSHHQTPIWWCWVAPFTESAARRPVSPVLLSGKEIRHAAVDKRRWSQRSGSAQQGAPQAGDRVVSDTQ